MTENREELVFEFKEHLIKYLNLLDLSPEQIKNDVPLFGDELGLDSIDSVELIVLLDREYGIKIKNPTEGRQILVDVNTIVDYIIANRTK
ncbi:phosphopantetheine-binding protein [Fluviicola taffensis]|uniref:Acyl carrier protein n=1 Tax=Fluviicola taffensis (strain DSM 16823 / NCIMB 13979 / RW262) TaxID=755732 RepID=F2IEC2_FLUTR|nr:phosphopantetheine-binding protein [Fluviicola taffensis]AEA43446.1 acyl carrier protein [Fluviicola taffensis DSM 16823]